MSYTSYSRVFHLLSTTPGWGSSQVEVAAVSFLAVIVAGAFWLAVSWPCDFGSRMID